MEKWTPSRGSKFYEVSSCDRIRVKAGVMIRSDGKPYTVNEHYVRPFKTHNGYYVVTLNYDIKRKCLIHRLVMENFCPTDGSDLLFVNHIDGNKTNNNIENLEWCSREYNAQHAMRLGLFRPQDRVGEKHPMCKLTSEQVEEIRNQLKGRRGEQHSLALKYGVSDTTISEIKSGRTRKRA